MGSNSAGIGGLLPPQTSDVASYILTTDGQTASWEASSASLPSQGGQSGKYLTTNGTVASWASVVALPDQTGNNGKFLTTNGTTASWAAGIGGVTTMAAVGSSPNADGASIATDTLTLQPADGTNPGVLSTAAQTIAGAKTFTGALVVLQDGAGGAKIQGTGGSAYFGFGSTNLISSNAVTTYYDAQVHNFRDFGGSPTLCSMAAAGMDLSGMNVGAYIKLRSPDGTVYTLTVANGGTWAHSP